RKVSNALRAEAGLLTPEQIRRQREELGLTQKQLADALQVGESTLSRWETGGALPHEYGFSVICGSSPPQPAWWSPMRGPNGAFVGQEAFVRQSPSDHLPRRSWNLRSRWHNHSGSAGLARWKSTPASREWSRSASRGYPLTAMMTGW